MVMLLKRIDLFGEEEWIVVCRGGESCFNK